MSIKKELELKNYFPEYFLQDNKVYNNKYKHSCFCGRVIDDFWKNKNNSDFKDLKLFFITSFELNLIGQILFTYFKKYYDFFQSKINYTHARCNYDQNPIAIIRWVSREEKGYFDSSDFLEADKFFLNYLIDILKENGINKKEIEFFKKELIEKMNEDEDIKYALTELLKLI